MSARVKRYNKVEMVLLMRDEGLTAEDCSYLAALETYGVVGSAGNDGAIQFINTTNVKVLYVNGEHPTGYYQQPGQARVIVINEDTSVLDYDLMSELHGLADAEIYLWLDHPWIDDQCPLGIHGEWYRRDTYKDGMLPFDGKTLGWEDLPSHMVEGIINND